ncbi:MAG: hypothetical protein Q9M50_07165 [Methylococcales bacterium]|nr:hypothetical protein [Methylococcales bacterium]
MIATNRIVELITHVSQDFILRIDSLNQSLKDREISPKDHGGKIGCKNQKNNETQFYFSLPLRDLQ